MMTTMAVVSAVVVFLVHGAAGLVQVRPPASIVVLGPGASEVNLIAAKVAAKAGYRATSVASGSTENARTLYQNRALMYGKAYADAGIDAKGKAAVCQGPAAIGPALKEAVGAIVCCDESSGPPSEGFVRALFDREFSPKLKSVAFLSKIDGGKGGLLKKSLAPGEALLRRAAADRGCALSVVRAGALKGGGPGKISRERGTAGTSATDWGLDAFYYNTLVELSSAMAVMAHDQFTLGASVAAGDPYKQPNPFVALGTAGDFEPRKTDANRVVVAQALLAACARARDADFSVSSKEADAPPTFDEWNKLLDAALD